MRTIIAFMFLSTLCSAEHFVLGDYSSEGEREIVRRGMIAQAFELAGHTIEFAHRPAERSLREANLGLLDGDVMRQPDAVKSFNNLLMIDVPLAFYQYWVYMAADTPCPSTQLDIWQLKPVGLVGFRYFDTIYAQSRSGYHQVSNVSSVMDMLASQRADYSVMSAEAYDILSARYNLNLTRCFDSPLLSYPVYTYLHSKHAHHIPALTKAYEHVFGE